MLEELDERVLTNHVFVITRYHLITRYQMKPEDGHRLNQLRHLKVTLLFTYSGVENKKIHPYPSHVAVKLLKLMGSPPWRRSPQHETPVRNIGDKQLMQRVLDGLHRLDSRCSGMLGSPHD